MTYKCETENQRTEAQMIADVSSFIDAAFCVNGTTEFDSFVEFNRGDDLIKGGRYKINDEKRGEFFVIIAAKIK